LPDTSLAPQNPTDGAYAKNYLARRSVRADIQMTQQIIAVANPLGISVHDHIIVGKEGHASLKGLKLV